MALLALAATAGCVVTAVHVDHGLRRGSADEAIIVEKAAERFGTSFVGHTVRVGPGPNLEARARTARYAVLGPDALTGHTMDDQTETVLLNLMRGGAMSGLAGMRPDRRPLLALRRAETHELCRSFGLDVVDDPTNSSPAHRRNRVRAELVPLLDDICQRDVTPVVARQAELWRDDTDLLDELAAGIDPTDARAVASAPIALARRAVRRWLAGEHPPDSATVERVLAVARGEAAACETNDGRRISRHRQHLSLEGPPLR
jgi:tRNA(Ile)-lysidine synthase